MFPTQSNIPLFLENLSMNKNLYFFYSGIQNIEAFSVLRLLRLSVIGNHCM